MSLNNYRDAVQQFMLKLGDKAFDSPTILTLLEQELATLKANLTNKTIVDHQIYDILFLLMELAVHNQTDLDSAWRAGQERKKKYLEKS
ncbi:MAG: hypothetical protein WCW33_04345 [Candidatus Babeliales bacterium]|jgi:hypothetical protein